MDDILSRLVCLHAKRVLVKWICWLGLFDKFEVQLCLLVVLRSSFVLNVDLLGLSSSFAGLIQIVLLIVHFICAEHDGSDFDLLFIFLFLVCTFLFVILHWVCCHYYWFVIYTCVSEVCILCLSYFAEFNVSTIDFIFLLYWKTTGDFSIRFGISCTATWKCKGVYWKCVGIFLWTYLLFMIFLLCTSLLHEFYFVLL